MGTGRRILVAEHPFVQDLIGSVQKRALLAELRNKRDWATTPQAASALTWVIRLVEGGKLDG